MYVPVAPRSRTPWPPIFASGGAFTTWIVRDAVAIAPRLSSTRTPTVWSPVVANTWLRCTLVPPSVS